MEDVKTKINRFYDIIRHYEEGGPGTRYKSWEWCHQAFLNGKDNYSKVNDDKEKMKLSKIYLCI